MAEPAASITLVVRGADRCVSEIENRCATMRGLKLLITPRWRRWAPRWWWTLRGKAWKEKP